MAILSLILFRCAKRSILPDRITLLEVTSTGASFDLLRHRKRARKVTVRIPQRKVAKFKLRIATSFSIFSEKSGTKTFMAAVYSRFYKIVTIVYMPIFNISFYGKAQSIGESPNPLRLILILLLQPKTAPRKRQ